MAVTPTQAPATAAGPEIKDPTLTQQLMLDAPFGDDLCVISARGTGKSWGIVMLVARDAAHWKERYSCLITRTTYQGLTELQGLLWRYLSVAFPGTTYSGGDMTFRVGGKDMPFGRVELAYTGAGPAEQVATDGEMPPKERARSGAAAHQRTNQGESRAALHLNHRCHQSSRWCLGGDRLGNGSR